MLSAVLLFRSSKTRGQSGICYVRVMMIDTPISSTPGLARISVGGSSNSSIRRRSLIPQIKPRNEVCGFSSILYSIS